MAGRFDNFKDGILQEFSDELYDLNKRIDSLNQSVGASEDALKLQSENFTKFAVETIERLEEYSAAKRKEVDEDIAEALDSRSKEATQAFESQVSGILESSKAKVEELNGELETATHRLQALERYAESKPVPKWAKALIVLGVALLFVGPAASYMLGKQVSAQETQNMMNYIVSMDESELSKLRETLMD
ncbi:MAG: hypothetical protein HLX50_18015 [Alteromonadaceae bacterium]|nr:hypothetical protein [Alteromonadaceae bacterium]